MDLPIFDDEQVTALTPWPELIAAIRDTFREAGVAPVRHHHSIPGNDREDITLLVMPAWDESGEYGIKLASIAPSNASQGLSTLHGVYILFDGRTGQPRAFIDAGALTARRTAAASALASRHLSRPDSRILFIIGTGRVARQLAAAHCAVRPIETIRVWGRTAENAEDATRAIGQVTGRDVQRVADVDAGADGADIISSATSAETPVIHAAQVGPGTHVDLVGAFRPTMCEADAGLVAAAGQVYVDTIDGARDEAGDLLQAADAGVFSFEDIAGDLYRLSEANGSLRNDDAEITIFKSVGTALEDLAAAKLCLRSS